VTALFFVCLIACIFAGIAILESEDAATKPFRFGPGLIGWLTSGNWPAKVGGGLLIIGIGALLRYALLHIDVAPSSKLASGVAASVALMATAHWVRTRFGRREISVALAGASFGVAYLTAYSAYALFHYLESFPGLALLTVIAFGAGAYAVWRNAVSIGMLSLFGAFLAPAFALDHPSAGMVYGYYLAISQLTLMMVAIRGWRALIHLSFLFTLGGGLFFAWTSGFYQPQHVSVMQPLLLALIVVHVAMPLVEQRSPLSQWMKRFDLAYFIALPVTSVVLFSIIAPDSHAHSMSLVLLGSIWLVAAVAVRLLAAKGVARHAAVGAVLLTIGLYLHVPSWPWFLIAQAVSALALVGAQRWKWTRAPQEFALSSTLLFSALFLADTLRDTVTGMPFLNLVVLERIAASAMLLVAGRACRKLQHPMAPLLGWFGAIGLVNITALELYRWDILSWPLIVHSALIIAAIVVFVVSRRAVAKSVVTTLAAAIALTAWWAAADASTMTAAAMLVLAPVSLVAMSLRSHTGETDYANGNRVLAMSLAPLVAWIWAYQLGQSLLVLQDQFALALSAVFAVAAYAIARWTKGRSEGWIESIGQIYAVVFAAILQFFTLFFIQRGVWPVALDLACLAGLAQLSVTANGEGRRPLWLYAMSMVGAALVVQAMLLRLLGPSGTLTIVDVLQLQWPAVISLFWSSLGATLTILARNVRSRSLWSLGALVLVACAVKLVLFDFGSLGELANILALIAAGLVFLLVSWLAPLPPKDDQDDAAQTPPPEAIPSAASGL
jgi:hypothetical protein